MEKHFVTFLSPGTFVAEESTRPIDDWNVDIAVSIARQIKERHGAPPYGFYFTTRPRDEDELDSKKTKRSPMYYLGGKIKTLEELERENSPDNRILISNMRVNKWDRVIVNTNSWRWTQPLEKDDIVLDFSK